MTFVDKAGLLSRATRANPVALELGCGDRKMRPYAVGVDILDTPATDVVGDVYTVLASLPDESVASVFASHFVEHLDSLPRLLESLSRVLADGAEIVFVAPHFSNPYFYSDPTHRNFFGLYTFCYFANSGDLFRRGVPQYDNAFPLEITSVRLGFRSPRQFPVRHAVKRTLGSVLDSCRYWREFYEENLTWIVPCYEVTYLLNRVPRVGARPH